MTDPAHFKRGPLLAARLSTEFRQYVTAELDEDGRHRFRRKVGPEFTSDAEVGHEDSGLTIHMEDVHRRGEDHHACIEECEGAGKSLFRRDGPL